MATPKSKNDPDSLVVPSSPKKSSSEFIEKIEKREGLTASIQTRKHINTPRDAILHAGIDPDVWEVTTCQIKTYQVTISGHRSSTKEDVTYQMFSVNLTCSRRISQPLMDAAKILADRTLKRAYKLPRIRYRKPKSDPSTLVVGLTDHHFGKLAYRPEVRESYSLKIAKGIWVRAIQSALNRCIGHEITQIILPIGNDMCHVDTRRMTTESGTQMDYDSRYMKIADVAMESMMMAIERLRAVAPVDVIWVPGNHDYLTSRWLCKVAQVGFGTTKHVSVDVSDCSVKYRQFGRCLLGFAHGHAPKIKSLREMMPVEAAEWWAMSPACREILTGHLHTQIFRDRPSTDEQAGIVARTLPSLCATDTYHYEGGWSLSKKTTQSLLYSNQHGMSCIFSDPLEKLMEMPL